MIILAFVVAVAAVGVEPGQLTALEDLMLTLTEDRQTFRLFAGGGTDCPVAQPGDGMVSCDLNGNVRILHAFNKRLRGNLSDTQWSAFSNLTYVNLAQNSIYGTFPKSFASLSSLQFLYVQRNRITGPLKEPLGTRLLEQLLGCSVVAQPASSEFNCFSDNLDADLLKCGGNAEKPLPGCLNPPETSTLPPRLFTIGTSTELGGSTTVANATSDTSVANETEIASETSANAIGEETTVDQQAAIDESNRVALGVGLAFGCVILVVIGAVIGCFVYQRRKQQALHSKMVLSKNKPVDMEIEDDNVSVDEADETSHDALMHRQEPVYTALPPMAQTNGNWNAGVQNRASMSILPPPIYTAAPAQKAHYDSVPPVRKQNVYEQCDAPLEF
jgi:hypothetical protein